MTFNGSHASGDKTATNKLIPSNSKKSKSPDKIHSALLARRKVVRLLIAVIISFAACTLPYNLRMLYTSWATLSLSDAEALAGPISFLFLYFNSGLNPCLYAFLSDNFRKCLREVITCSANKNRDVTSVRGSTVVTTAKTNQKQF